MSFLINMLKYRECNKSVGYTVAAMQCSSKFYRYRCSKEQKLHPRVIKIRYDRRYVSIEKGGIHYVRHF